MNKKNINVTWPNGSIFTLKELFALNRDLYEITLRVRVTKQIAMGKIVEIGNKTGGKGRPEKLFCFTPFTRADYEQAKNMNIQFVQGAEKLIGKTETELVALANESRRKVLGAVPVTNILQSSAVPA